MGNTMLAKTSRLRRLLALSFVAGVAAGCAVPPDDAPAGESSSELNATGALPEPAVARWNAYVARVTSGVTLQEDCKPRRMAPAAGVRVRGVVVLFHGFTACPQQYFEMAGSLNAEGFEVLLPLLPGHGRVARMVDGKRIEDIDDLPTVATRSKYTALAEEMTTIARDARGTRVVGGLSMGGMVATAAMQRGPDVWTRGILFAPFFGAPGLQGWGAQIAGTLAPGTKRSWGAECVSSTVPGRRAGICEFTLGNLEAGRTLGAELIANARTIRLPVQIVGVEADGAADNGAMTRLFENLGGKREACFYAKGMPHAFISKHDHEELDHAWLPALHRATTAFVTDETRFPTTAGLSSEHGFFLCTPR